VTSLGEAAESMCSAPPANAPTRPRVGALVVKNPLSMRTVPWTAGWAAPRQTRRLVLEAPTRRSGLVGAAPGARGSSKQRPACSRCAEDARQPREAPGDSSGIVLKPQRCWCNWCAGTRACKDCGSARGCWAHVATTLTNPNPSTSDVYLIQF
jgi:hypothetical protein